MTTKQLLLFVSACVAAGSTRATEPAKSACCAPAQPSCGVSEKPAASPAANHSQPLSVRSLYQLDAAWTNDASERVQLASFRGRPVVLTMFFASCEYACPLLVADLHRVREALPAEVRAQTQFVLVSFDPERDTATALKAYREGRGLDEAWTLLRGDAGSVQELAMLLGVKFKQDARGQFSHSNVITVLNAEGEVAFQRNGLQGDAGEPARAIVAAAAKK